MSDTLDVRSFVEDLSTRELKELIGAIDIRLCREKYGSESIDDLLTKHGRIPLCPNCSNPDVWLDGETSNQKTRYHCQICDCRFSALSNTIFANTKLPLYKIMKIIELMCCNASLKIVRLSCNISYSTAFLWRHKIFSTVNNIQDNIILSDKVWIDEMYFSDTRIERKNTNGLMKRGLSKDKICVVVAIDISGNAIAIVSDNGKPSTKSINKALEKHIQPKSTLIHDCEKAHNSLVKNLELDDRRYKANIRDREYLEAMKYINFLCAWIRRYIDRFACIKSENLQSYLNWFIFLHNTQQKEEKCSIEESVVFQLATSKGCHLRKW